MLFNFICRTILTPARPYIKLQLCCHGLLSSSSYQSFLFTTETSCSSNRHSFTVTYLINSCGVSPESATLASRSLDLSKSPNAADSVLAILNKLGFTKSQVSKVVCRHPKILLCDPEKTLLPNFQIWNSIGLSNADLVSIVTAVPSLMLRRKFQDTAILCVDYLRTLLESDDKVIYAIKRFPLALTYDFQVYAADNVKMLLEIGVPRASVKVMLAKQPRTFFTSADRFTKVVRYVKEMGFDPSKFRFLLAIHACRAMSKSTWDKKVELYKKWGWSEDEIFTAFEKYPGCMMASTDKIARILDFLMNTMGWEASYIAQWPIVLCFSLEKRIIPRCLVYLYLAEKGLIEEKDDLSFTKWLMYSETKFLKWVVKRYEEEASEILKLYKKHLNEANGLTTSILKNQDGFQTLWIAAVQLLKNRSSPSGKEYSKGDSRYVGRDSTVVAVEGITAILEGPVCILAVYAITTRKPYSRLLQIASALGQLYVTAVYFITSYLEGDYFTAGSATTISIT